MNSTVKYAFAITIITTIFVGVIGNVVSFVVFLRPTFRKHSISIYCRALAICDSLVIYNAIVQFGIVLDNYIVILYSDALCKLFNYMMYAFGSLPGWILIGMSVDKVLNLKKVTNGMGRPLVHYAIIAGIVLFNLLLYIEILIYVKLEEVEISGKRVRHCDTSTLSFANILHIIYVLHGSVLPFLILSSTSLYTYKLLRDSTRNVILAVGQVAYKRRSNRDIKFAVTSLTFNILYVVLKCRYFSLV